MPGVSKVPANGRQTPLLGATCVPSMDRVKSGFGRKNAVISCAFDSSMFSLSASSVGLFSSKRSFTCSQVQARDGDGAGGAVCGAPCAAPEPVPKATNDNDHQNLLRIQSPSELPGLPNFHLEYRRRSSLRRLSQ